VGEKRLRGERPQARGQSGPRIAHRQQDGDDGSDGGQSAGCGWRARKARASLRTLSRERPSTT
jgi:hypothetical protein